MIKLQRDNFSNVTDALYHLKKYTNEKFIINTSSLKNEDNSFKQKFV